MRNLEFEIEKRFGLKECIIVPSYEERDETLKAMAVRLGNTLERLASSVSYIGIGWGTTLKSVSDYLR
ncbi:MAG: sugar-binding domain-containing protein [Actinomycetota bacterium]|nr:sugar-binding domain-containing protein [Actinomycetota bacterium]